MFSTIHNTLCIFNILFNFYVNRFSLYINKAVVRAANTYILLKKYCYFNILRNLKPLHWIFSFHFSTTDTWQFSFYIARKDLRNNLYAAIG